MRRILFCVVGILVIGLAPAFVLAQGLLGAGLPGLPSLGGFMGGSGGCGDKAAGFAGPTLYVGWGASDPKTSFGAGAENLGVLGFTEINHKYRDSGIWLGASVPIGLSEYFSILASGWYLIPAGNENTEENYGGPQTILGRRTWSTSTQWWYVDGLVALSCRQSGAALLAGLRYDYYTTKFSDPTTVFGGSAADEGDVTSEGWIPLLGVQYSLNSGATSLLARFVGIPALVGNVKYHETILGTNRLEATGNWNGAYFWEFFTEYDRKFNQNGAVGVFGRVQSTNGRSDLDVTVNPAGVNDTFRLGFKRLNWTIGGSINLSFNLPMM